MNRIWYLFLWVLEVLAIAGLVLAFALPIQDNALREYIQWQQHPSPETYQAFLEKRTQAHAVRFIFAVPCGVTAVVPTENVIRPERL